MGRRTRTRGPSCAARAALVVALLCAGPAGSAAPPRGDGVVAAESPLAVEAGLGVLRDGGSAVDAAIATALAVCVVNPSSCGIGGGGFMVVFDAATARAVALDYRETAPAAATADRFDADGTYDPKRSRRGPLAIGVPGEIAGLWAAHQRFGRLPWARLLLPAVKLARDGFPIGEHLGKQIAGLAGDIAADPELAQVLLDAEGKPRRAGDPLRAPHLAETLEAVASGGPAAFYEGRIGRAIAAEVRARGGALDEADLTGYRPLWRDPLRTTYRGATVYTMPPPTRWQLFAEILKHAFADRAHFAGDPAFDPPHALPAGNPLAGRLAASRTFDPAHYGTAAPAARDGGTSHVSVISADGSAVACTTTINTSFGALVGVAGTGILLNNEIDDFSFAAPNAFGLAPGGANQIAPGKRPASSMTPTVAVEDRRAVVAVGASGGPLIVSATLEVLSNVLDFDLPPEAAVAAPRVHHQWQPDVLLVEPGVREVDRLALERVGHAVREIPGVAAVSLATAWPGRPAAAAGDRRKGGAGGSVRMGQSQRGRSGSPEP